MPLKRLILLLSLLVVVTFMASAAIYHATLYINRLNAAKAEAKNQLEATAERLTNQMLDWQRFARALVVATPIDPTAPESPPTDRLKELVAQTNGLRGMTMAGTDGQAIWQVGETPAPAEMTCSTATGARSTVHSPVMGGQASLVHCLPLGEGAAESSPVLILATQLETLNFALPTGELLHTILVDTNGYVLAGGQFHGIERYPIAADDAPLTGSVVLAGEEYDAATLPVAGITDTHLVALTSHNALWKRMMDPLLDPVGLVYILMAALLIVVVRKLYRAAEQDVHRRERVEQKLRRSEALYRELSISDSLTGLYNRRKFHSDLHHELSRNHRYQRPLSLAVMDVDYFKYVNDHHGHAEGDRILRLIGRLLRSTRRKSDAAYRVGGEEFVLLLPETTAQDAAVVVQRIQASLAETPLETEAGETLTVSMSVGIAQFDGQESERAFFNRADAAMYEVKHHRRGSLMLAPENHEDALVQPERG